LPLISDFTKSNNLSAEEKEKYRKAEQHLAKRLEVLDIAIKGGWSAGNNKY
jgi:hypothetical protein